MVRWPFRHCPHCDKPITTQTGGGAFDTHVRRCMKATPAERRHYKRTGRWPSRKPKGETDGNV